MADALLAGDWKWKGHPSVALDPPLDWQGLCAENRSWSLALHSWEPLGISLAAYDNVGGDPYLDFALALALDWLDRFPFVDGASSPFAWYDLAVGARASRLAYLLDAIARDPERDDEVVSLLLEGLRLHATSLADEKRFASHSNHGFYQVMGQLAMARRFPELPEIAAAAGQGRERLEALVDSHFTGEGVHREHSPQYHRLILIPLRALKKAELVSDDHGLDALCERIEEALAWFITPARRLAMFGDTDRKRIPGSFADRYISPHLAFAASGGSVGEPPHASTRGFPESGYVVFRDRWPSGERDFADCSYLAQTCAFHSRVHKHADDLSFVWYDRECDILTDAGRFGYVGKTEPDSALRAEGFWYSDPARVYVESTRAHNTVEIDGKSSSRRVQPYGSALTQWGECGEIRFSEARIQHGELSHVRVLVFMPRSWLIVLDSLSDSGHTPHDFVQWFHLAPELDLIEEQERVDGAISVELPSEDRLHSVALLPQAPVQPVRGTDEPHLLGWLSPRDGVLEPQWTFGWEATGVSSHTFASLFCFGEEPPTVNPASNEVDDDASIARLQWDVDGEHHSVALARTLGRSFEAEHSLVRPRQLESKSPLVPRTYS